MKMLQKKKISKTLSEEYMGLSIFFYLRNCYSTYRPTPVVVRARCQLLLEWSDIELIFQNGHYAAVQVYF